MIKIIAYTDGSAVTKRSCECEKETCPKCQRFGGIGSYIRYNNKDIFLSKGYKNTTVSRMEMKAVLHTINKIPVSLKCILIVYSDSQFVCNSFNKGWLNNWKKQNFEDRLNSDIWKRIVKSLDERRDMGFVISHTKGHRTDFDSHVARGNHIADILANYKRHKIYHEDKRGQK